MTQIQLECQRFTDLAAARALRQDSDFPSRFIQSFSPSDVARHQQLSRNQDSFLGWPEVPEP